MKHHNFSVLGYLVVLILIAGLSPLQAQTANVTIHNDTSSYLTLFDVTTGTSVDNLDPPNGAATTYPLLTNHTFTLEHYFYQNTGHPFSFSAGQIVPGGTAPTTSPFFQVTGNDIYVSGIRVFFKLVTDNVGFGIQGLYADYSFSIPFSAAFSGGADAVVNLIPADTNFIGTYNMAFFSPGANTATLQLGTNMGVASFTGAGASFVFSGPYSILATLSNGNVFEITAIPEPSALAISLFVALLGFGFRSNRTK